MTNGLKPKNILPSKPLNLIDNLATQSMNELLHLLALSYNITFAVYQNLRKTPCQNKMTPM